MLDVLGKTDKAFTFDPSFYKSSLLGDIFTKDVHKSLFLLETMNYAKKVGREDIYRSIKIGFERSRRRNRLEKLKKIRGMTRVSKSLINLMYSNMI